MLLLAGLGNPGDKYRDNRHNVGFMAVDEIIHRHRFSAPRKRFHGDTAEGVVGGEKVLALKPMTFMNKSGKAVAAAANFYKLPPERVVVLYDELDLAPGKVRVKRGGGAGGHNGIRDIDAHFAKDYWRVRIGIGHPGEKARVMGHVLGDFGKADRDWLFPVLEAISSELSLLVDGDHEKFMSRVAHLVGPVKVPGRGEKES